MNHSQAQKNKPKQTQSVVLSKLVPAKAGIIRPQSSVFGPLFPDEAQIIEFSPQKKFDSLVKFGKIPLFV